jgi:delta8-fatty-acid desaturase
VQQGVDQGVRDYPSVDPIVQQGIINRYQALHQQIRDEGLYSCRYIEYGKEMIRYTSLFIGFLTALYFEWYMTSAVMLGLFWVSISVFLLPNTCANVSFHQSSIKSCSLLMMLAI